MHTIVSIESVESWAKDGKPHHRTTALLDNQEEAAGYGLEFKPGDKVECWYDEKHCLYKMRLPVDKQ